MAKILSITKDDIWFVVHNHVKNESVSFRTEYSAFKEVEKILSTIEWEKQKQSFENGYDECCELVNKREVEGDAE